MPPQFPSSSKVPVHNVQKTRPGGPAAPGKQAPPPRDPSELPQQLAGCRFESVVNQPAESASQWTATSPAQPPQSSRPCRGGPHLQDATASHSPARHPAYVATPSY